MAIRIDLKTQNHTNSLFTLHKRRYRHKPCMAVLLMYNNRQSNKTNLGNKMKALITLLGSIIFLSGCAQQQKELGFSSIDFEEGIYEITSYHGGIRDHVEINRLLAAYHAESKGCSDFSTYINNSIISTFVYHNGRIIGWKGVYECGGGEYSSNTKLTISLLESRHGSMRHIKQL